MPTEKRASHKMTITPKQIKILLLLIPGCGIYFDDASETATNSSSTIVKSSTNNDHKAVYDNANESKMANYDILT